MRCLRTSDLIPERFRPSAIAQPLRSGLRNMMAAWDQDEFVLDPSRITLFIGPTGYDGDTFKRQHLMDRYGIQINKTSRNSVLFMTDIGTTRSSVAFLVEVLVNIARELDQNISEMSLGERERFERAVASAYRNVFAPSRFQRVPPRIPGFTAEASRRPKGMSAERSICPTTTPIANTSRASRLMNGWTRESTSCRRLT
jgi:hypothetical protein